MRAKTVYEAIKHLTPRDEKDFQKDIEKELARDENNVSPDERRAIKSGDQNLIYHVFSGVDAFQFIRNIKNVNAKVYPMYIAVIAKNQRDAREKVAKILGQKLIDQVIGGDYNNYVYMAEFIPNSQRYNGILPEDMPISEKPKTANYHIHLKEEHPAIFTTEKNEKIPMPYIAMLGNSEKDVLRNASIFIGRELKPEDVRIKFIEYF